jgi:O-antigen/teichoic acid export membrane protein
VAAVDVQLPPARASREAVAPPRRRMFLPQRLWTLLPDRAGAFWVLFAMATPKLFGPIVTIGLRRFLGPGASGTFDLASTPYKFLDNFRNFGTGPALVFEKSVSKAVANTAWTLNMLFAVIVTAAAQLLAHPIALYYGHPEIEGIFRVLSIAYVFASVGSVHSFLLMRDLDFRARSIPALGQVIAAGDIAVVCAAWGFGVGSLVARELTSVVAGAVLLWAVYPFRPRIQLVPHLAWKLFRYGAWIGAGLTILYVSQNVDVFIGGRIIQNTSDVGFYTTSWKLAFIAAGVFTAVASGMVFPTLSRLQGDFIALQAKLLTSIRQVGLLMFPAAALLAALAPVVIVPLLGEKWAPYRSSFLVLSLLAAYAGNRTMLSIFFEGYKAIGKPWIVPVYNTVKLAVMVPAMIFGAQHGILGLALTYIPVQLLEVPAALTLAHRVLKVSPRQVWKAASTPILATLLMTASVIAAEVGLLSLRIGDLASLALCLPVAGMVYLGTLWLIDRRIFLEARGVLLKGF